MFNNEKAIVLYKLGETGGRPSSRLRVLKTGAGLGVKRMEVCPGHRLSLQYQHHRFEAWIIVAGAGVVESNVETITVATGDRARIPLLAHHRMSNTGTELFVVIEVQHGVLLYGHDIVGIEDDYAR